MLRRFGPPLLVPALTILAWSTPGLLTPPVAAVEAQVRPVYSQGVAGVLQAIHGLQTTASALHTGAHPDDEDTAFIARTARGDHARVAYLSLTRGEGGQNAIGPELFEALGVIRTEELLQARALDGGGQYFTRACDFGYSKRMEEAAVLWGEDAVLEDMVRVIRAFRPLVVYAGFSGTSADGHGQHQFAGRLTPLAYAAAADPAAFPEQIEEGLRPWQAKKLYVRRGFRPDPSSPAPVNVPTGVFDPLLGRTYFEIAMEGRSQHRSQKMGMPELRGEQASAMRLVDSRVSADAGGEGVFSGIDTSLRGLGVLAGLPPTALATELGALAEQVDQAVRTFDAARPAKVVPMLARGLYAARLAREVLADAAGPAAARDEADFLLATKEAQFEEALRRAAGITLDPLADRETVVPGDGLGVRVRLFVPEPGLVRVESLVVTAPAGWLVEKSELAVDRPDNPMARFFRETPSAQEGFRVTVPVDEGPTQPYWLEDAREGALFVWPPDAPPGQPFAPALLHGEARVSIAGVEVTLRAPVEYRLVDEVRGELRRLVNVVPAVTVALDSDLIVVPVNSLGQSRRVAVRLANHAERPAAGHVRLRAPDGWRVEPSSVPFTLPADGGRTAVGFTLTPPPATAAGAYEVAAAAEIEGHAFDRAMRTVAYPHIQTHRLYAPAVAQVRVLDLEVAPVRVGYVMGSGDQVPDAIRRLGLEVMLLGEEELAAGDLSRFDVIVAGIRASEARPDFVANHERILEFVRQGGTFIVQYQQTDYAARGLAPYPVEYASRVADEHAAVTVLQPSHPAFTTPNRIGPDDWTGWVQERNLYAFSSFDDRYLPLLEAHDPGEPPQRGGQVYADLGRGRYVYTAYAWFRQLPAGVPGAYRLFANLLSLGATRSP